MERATSAAGVAEPAMFRGLDFYPGREHAKMEVGAIVLAALRHKPIGDEVALSDSAATRLAHFESNPLKQESTTVPEAPVINLHPPRLQERRALLMAGLQEHYTPQTANTIPAQWKRLPFGKISGQLGHMAYGVVFNVDEKSGEFDYFCGVEIATISPAHKSLATYKSPQQKYAIFCHRENVSRLRDSVHAIFTTWLPSSGQTLAHPTPNSPNLVEYYGESFDPESGTGDMEIWIPIKA